MELTSSNFTILNHGKWRIVFWVPWGNPSFQQLIISKKEKSNYNLILCNVEENIDIAQQFNVFFYPTTIFIINGIEQRRIVGLSKK